VAAYARARGMYSVILGDIEPMVIGDRVRGRGFRPFYRVRAPAATRAAAEALCEKILHAEVRVSSCEVEEAARNDLRNFPRDRTSLAAIRSSQFVGVTERTDGMPKPISYPHGDQRTPVSFMRATSMMAVAVVSPSRLNTHW
jgi:hypothetical protein